LEETIIVEKILTMAKGVWIQALGWKILDEARVIYARNAAQAMITGSSPIMEPNPKKKMLR
jgi:hypothetical protein